MGPSLNNLKGGRAEDEPWGGDFLGAVVLQTRILIHPFVGTRERGSRPCGKFASVISTSRKLEGCG